MDKFLSRKSKKQFSKKIEIERKVLQLLLSTLSWKICVIENILELAWRLAITLPDKASNISVRVEFQGQISQPISYIRKILQKQEFFRKLKWISLTDDILNT